MQTLQNIGERAIKENNMALWTEEGRKPFSNDAEAAAKKLQIGDMQTTFNTAMNAVAARYVSKEIDPNKDTNFSKVALDTVLSKINVTPLQAKQVYEDPRVALSIALQILAGQGIVSADDIGEMSANITSAAILERMEAHEKFYRYADRFKESVIKKDGQYTGEIEDDLLRMAELLIAVARGAWAERTVRRGDIGKLVDDPSFVTTAELVANAFSKDPDSNTRDQRLIDAVVLLWSDALQLSKTDFVQNVS